LSTYSFPSGFWTWQRSQQETTRLAFARWNGAITPNKKQLGREGINYEGDIPSPLRTGSTLLISGARFLWGGSL
jgi:hypothetical protein